MNTTSLTTQQKLDILTHDFLERDGDTFVKIRRTGRLGWESTIPEGGSYSHAVTGARTQEDVIKEAYKLACNMITVMDFKDKVRVNLSADTSCTDGRTVNVATKVFDEPGMTVGQKLDAFLGFAIHEGCHLLYTDFNAGGKDVPEIVRSFQNIIEDERIERLCGEAKPGLVNFIGGSKYYAFDKYHKRMAAKNAYKGLSPVQRFTNCLLSYIRYPKSLDPADLQEFCDPMLEVKEILTPYPASTQEALTAAEKIYDLLKNFHKEQQSQQSGKKNQEGGSDKGEKQQSGNQQSQRDTQSGSGSAEGSGSQQESESSFNEEMDAMKEALKEISANPQEGIDESQMSEVLKQDGGRVAKVCQGELEKGLNNGSYIEKAQENKNIYMESYNRVRQYIPAISKALKCSSTEYKLSLRGMRSGVLDTGKIAEAFQGVPTVYMREGEVKTNKVSVCILIDESGSMWGPGETAARDTAVLLNEALAKVPNIDLYIYGHTASRRTTDLFVYRERGFSRRYALGTTDSRAGNHDSMAIREAAARVRKHTKEKCLFFMISDGAPNESTEMVRKAVKDVEKDGFNLVAISIDPYYDPSTMYDHNVNLTDMSTLAISLGKLVKQSVLKNTKRTTNI